VTRKGVAAVPMTETTNHKRQRQARLRTRQPLMLDLSDGELLKELGNSVRVHFRCGHIEWVDTRTLLAQDGGRAVATAAVKYNAVIRRSQTYCPACNK